MSADVSGLYVGRVMHRRMRPRAHRLSYRIFMMLLDLDAIDRIAGASRLFSRNRFNLLSFHDRDHGDGSGVPLREQVERLLRAAGQGGAATSIRLLTMPRVLGYVFNPLSVYFCHCEDGRLGAILYEVHNTFGERHSYLIPVTGADDRPVRQSCQKALYVSPFIPMDVSYDFEVGPPGERVTIAIAERDAAGLLLTASFTGKRAPIGDATLLRAFLGHPLLTLKVVGGIHWEALRLWLKGVPLVDRPSAPDRPATLVAGGDPPASGRPAA